MEPSGDIFIGFTKASRRLLWLGGCPDISEVERIVHFYGGQKQVLIDALVRFFEPVGSSHIKFVQSATVSICKTLRDTELQSIDGNEIFQLQMLPKGPSSCVGYTRAFNTGHLRQCGFLLLLHC